MTEYFPRRSCAYLNKRIFVDIAFIINIDYLGVINPKGTSAIYKDAVSFENCTLFHTKAPRLQLGISQYDGSA